VSIRSHKVIVEQNLMNARSKACKERPVWQYHFWSQLVDMSSFRAQRDHFERRGESVKRVAKAFCCCLLAHCFVDDLGVALFERRCILCTKAAGRGPIPKSSPFAPLKGSQDGLLSYPLTLVPVFSWNPARSTPVFLGIRLGLRLQFLEQPGYGVNVLFGNPARNRRGGGRGTLNEGGAEQRTENRTWRLWLIAPKTAIYCGAVDGQCLEALVGKLICNNKQGKHTSWPQADTISGPAVGSRSSHSSANPWMPSRVPVETRVLVGS